MKKNNDGYVLPFVLVVMIVLTIISTSLMTAALRNLQSQQKFTERMVDKYEAEGEIEKIVAQLSNEINFVGFTYTYTPPATGNNELPWPDEDTIKNSLKTKIDSLCSSDLIGYDKIEITGNETEKDISCIVRIKSSKENPIITTVIEMKGKLTKKDRDAGVTGSEPTFSISDLKLTYNSYEISTGGGT